MIKKLPLQKNGFTLIELLVVIAILGILASVVFVVINPQRKLAEARDSKRITDLKQIGTGIQVFFTANRYYPAATCTYLDWERSEYPGDQGDCSGSKSDFLEYLKEEAWLKLIPLDPQHPLDSAVNGYLYQQQNSGQGFCLLAHLELSSNQITSNDSACDNSFPAPYDETWWYAIGDDK